MAASRAPHPLAEAIAELAAPPVAESFLLFFLKADSIHQPHGLVLHLRPRRLAAGLEACVRCGVWERGDGQASFQMLPSGPVFAVSSVPLAYGEQQHAVLAADIDSFVAQLLDATCTYPGTGGVRLQLPEQASELNRIYARTWDSVTLVLLPSTLGEAPAAAGRVRWRIAAGAASVLCESVVAGRSVAYARRQAAVREEQQRRSALQVAADAGDAESTAALAALPAEPAAGYDDDAAMEARYAELRADDMQRLAAAISNMLKLACRFRGTVSTPTGAQPVAVADAGQ